MNKSIVNKLKGKKDGLESILSPEAISKVMSELGKRGGKKTSKKKRESSRKSLEKARKSRWPGK